MIMECNNRVHRYQSDVLRYYKQNSYRESKNLVRKKFEIGIKEFFRQNTKGCAMFNGCFPICMQKIGFVEDQIKIFDCFREKKRFHAIIKTMIFDIFELEHTYIHMFSETENTHSQTEVYPHVVLQQLSIASKISTAINSSVSSPVAL